MNYPQREGNPLGDNDRNNINVSNHLHSNSNLTINMDTTSMSNSNVSFVTMKGSAKEKQKITDIDIENTSDFFSQDNSCMESNNDSSSILHHVSTTSHNNNSIMNIDDNEKVNKMKSELLRSSSDESRTDINAYHRNTKLIEGLIHNVANGNLLDTSLCAADMTEFHDQYLDNSNILHQNIIDIYNAKNDRNSENCEGGT